MSVDAENSRQAIAELTQEELDNLKEKVETAEEGEEIVIGEEETPAPEEKEETPEPKVPEETIKPEVKEEIPAPEEKKETGNPQEVDQLVDQYLSDVENKQDLSKYSTEEMTRIIHLQNKRLRDKDGFIDTLKDEKRIERQKLNQTITDQKKEYEEKLSKRMTKEELNELHHEDPMEAIDKREQYKKEDAEAEAKLIENQKAEKRLYNEEQMAVIDRRADQKFKDLVPEMKLILKSMNQFTEEQIEAFAKDPYLEDLEILLELKDRAVDLKARQNPNPSPAPAPTPAPADTSKKELEEKKNQDLATKINKAQKQTQPVRGTGSVTPEADLIGNLQQTSTGRYDLSKLSKEQLSKLKKQIDA